MEAVFYIDTCLTFKLLPAFSGEVAQFCLKLSVDC